MNLGLKKFDVKFQKLSLSKRSKRKNLSCENDFYLHQNNKSFSYQWLHFKPCFKNNRGLGNYKMASPIDLITGFPRILIFLGS